MRNEDEAFMFTLHERARTALSDSSTEYAVISAMNGSASACLTGIAFAQAGTLNIDVDSSQSGQGVLTISLNNGRFQTVPAGPSSWQVEQYSMMLMKVSAANGCLFSFDFDSSS